MAFGMSPTTASIIRTQLRPSTSRSQERATSGLKKAYKEGCTNCRRTFGFNEKQPEHRIADWLCRHACSFVLLDTKARATVIGFEREDDAHAFRREFV